MLSPETAGSAGRAGGASFVAWRCVSCWRDGVTAGDGIGKRRAQASGGCDKSCVSRETCRAHDLCSSAPVGLDLRLRGHASAAWHALPRRLRAADRPSGDAEGADRGRRLWGTDTSAAPCATESPARMTEPEAHRACLATQLSLCCGKRRPLTCERPWRDLGS